MLKRSAMKRDSKRTKIGIDSRIQNMSKDARGVGNMKKKKKVRSSKGSMKRKEVKKPEKSRKEKRSYVSRRKSRKGCLSFRCRYAMLQHNPCFA